MSAETFILGHVLERAKLPDGVKWYCVGGKKIFEVRGPDGAAKPELIAYAIKPTPYPRKWFKYGIGFDPAMSIHEAEAHVVTCLLEFEQKMKDATASSVDMDGGPLGFEG